MNDTLEWLSTHNCISITAVFSNKLQKFAADTNLTQGGILHIFFDYDEAQQACLDKQGNRMSGFRSHFYMLTDLETN